MFNGISVLFGQTIRHAAINQPIIECFSLLEWMAAYSLCLTAGCNVKVASFAISGPLTITLSAPESHNLSSQAGILSLGAAKIAAPGPLVGEYGQAVTCKCVSAGGHWSGGTPAGLSCTFFLVF